MGTQLQWSDIFIFSPTGFLHFTLLVIKYTKNSSQYTLRTLPHFTRCTLRAMLAAATLYALHSIPSGERMKALICLQEEITPLQHCPSKLHLLPSYLMCSSPADLRARSKWTGANGASRQRLIHKIQGKKEWFNPITQHLYSLLIN